MFTYNHDNVPTHDSIDHMFDLRYYEMIVLIAKVRYQNIGILLKPSEDEQLFQNKNQFLLI